MTTMTQQRPRQVPVETMVPAIRTPRTTQAEALLRETALVLALTRRVRQEILTGEALPA